MWAFKISGSSSKESRKFGGVDIHLTLRCVGVHCWVVTENVPYSSCRSPTVLQLPIGRRAWLLEGKATCTGAKPDALGLTERLPGRSLTLPSASGSVTRGLSVSALAILLQSFSCNGLARITLKFGNELSERPPEPARPLGVFISSNIRILKVPDFMWAF